MAYQEYTSTDQDREKQKETETDRATPTQRQEEGHNILSALTREANGKFLWSSHISLPAVDVHVCGILALS